MQTLMMYLWQKKKSFAYECYTYTKRYHPLHAVVKKNSEKAQPKHMKCTQYDAPKEINCFISLPFYKWSEKREKKQEIRKWCKIDPNQNLLIAKNQPRHGCGKYHNTNWFALAILPHYFRISRHVHLNFNFNELFQIDEWWNWIWMKCREIFGQT